jgi:hypothetical protein
VHTFHLHLRDPVDFFVPRSEVFDPLDPRAMAESGIDYIIGQVKGRGLRPPKIRATLYLPVAAMESNIESRMKEALGRYCAIKIQEMRRDRSQFFLENLVYFFIALGVVIVGLALQPQIASIDVPGGSEVRLALALGIDVITWVALWNPISAFVLDWYPFVRTGQLYAALMRMELKVQPEQPGFDPTPSHLV